MPYTDGGWWQPTPSNSFSMAVMSKDCIWDPSMPYIDGAWWLPTPSTDGASWQTKPRQKGSRQQRQQHATPADTEKRATKGESHAIGNAAAAAEGRAVYVRGIPLEWSVMHLKQFLGDPLTVESANMLPIKVGQRGRAAFVNFLTPNDAEAAVKAHDHERVENSVGETSWISCNLKRDAQQKVDITKPSYNHGPTEILDGFLFLGNVANAEDRASLAFLGIDHVLVALDCDSGVDTLPPYHEGIRYLHLNFADNAEVELCPHLDRAYDFIEDASRAGGRILVHCRAGRSRSAALVISYLMRKQGSSLHDAFTLLKQRRPCVLPNLGFWQQLQAEEVRLLGVGSPHPELYDVGAARRFYGRPPSPSAGTSSGESAS